MPWLNTYLVSARTYDGKPVRFELVARNSTDALLAAQELYPDHLISAARLLPDWGDAS